MGRCLRSKRGATDRERRHAMGNQTPTPFPRSAVGPGHRRESNDVRTPRVPAGRGPSVYQTGHQHMCAVLRGVLVETVQAGRRAAGGIGTIPGQAIATLYMFLMNHPVDGGAAAGPAVAPAPCSAGAGAAAECMVRPVSGCTSPPSSCAPNSPANWDSPCHPRPLLMTSPACPNAPAVPVPPLPPGVSRAGRPDPVTAGPGCPPPAPGSAVTHPIHRPARAAHSCRE